MSNDPKQPMSRRRLCEIEKAFDLLIDHVSGFIETRRESNRVVEYIRSRLRKRLKQKRRAMGKKEVE